MRQHRPRAFGFPALIHYSNVESSLKPLCSGRVITLSSKDRIYQ
ncbi:MAG: hypothetical protein ACMUEL_07035 [Flavobacteriales bacterium Tduv]